MKKRDLLNLLLEAGEKEEILPLLPPPDLEEGEGKIRRQPEEDRRAALGDRIKDSQ